MQDLVSLLERFGVPMGLVIFFVWWSWAREKGMGARLTNLEDYVRTKLVALVETTTIEITRTGTIIEANTLALGSICKAIEKCKREEPK